MEAPMVVKSISLVALLVICFMLLSANTVAAQNNPLPAPTGEYKVGVAWRHWTDQTRDETFDEAPHGKREMMVEFLYPIDEAPVGAASQVYMENHAAVLPAFSATLASVGVEVAPDISQFADFETYAFANAALSNAEESYPVLIFSHGAGGEVSMYTTQLEELASHGYIVVAINHSYGAAATVFPDGRTVTANFSTGLEGAAPIWAQDQIFVIDQLELLNQNDPEARFTGRLDLNRLGIFGHSLGGAAATITCFMDERCKAGANEDGPVYGDVIEQGLKQPFLYFLSDSLIFADPEAYQNAQGPLYLVDPNGFEHLNYGDWPYWTVAPEIQDAGWLGSAESGQSVEVTRTYLVAFFDKYLRGMDGTLLDDSSAAYPEVTVTTLNVP